jgi:hypothetical protein
MTMPAAPTKAQLLQQVADYATENERFREERADLRAMLVSTVPTWTPSAPITSMCSLISAMAGSLCDGKARTQRVTQTGVSYVGDSRFQPYSLSIRHAQITVPAVYPDAWNQVQHSAAKTARSIVAACARQLTFTRVALA